MIARIHGLDRRRERVDQALERLGLTARRSQLAGSLSGGWKQRLALAACLLLAFVAIALVSSALSGVYAAAVYRYAADGQSDGFFTPAMVKRAFREK